MCKDIGSWAWGPFLERELQPKLNQARITHRGIDHSECGAAKRIARWPKLRTVEQIEEFSAEFNIHSLRRTEACPLKGCKVPIVHAVLAKLGIDTRLARQSHRQEELQNTPC